MGLRWLYLILWPLFVSNAVAWELPVDRAYTELSQRQISGGEHRLVLGSLARINGEVVAEREQFLSGSNTSTLYELPSQTSPAVAVGKLSDLMRIAGGEVRFSCRGKDCGSSHYWSTYAFSERLLYGLEETQAYEVVRVGGKQYALYGVQRGNRRAYMMVVVLQSVDSQFATSLGSGFVKVGSDTDLFSIVKWLEENPKKRLWLIAAGGESGKRDRASLDLCYEVAEQWLQDIERTLSAQLAETLRASVNIYPVGYFAPSLVGEESAVQLYLFAE